MATIRAADGGYLLNSDQFNYTKDAQGRPVLNVKGVTGAGGAGYITLHNSEGEEVGTPVAGRGNCGVGLDGRFFKIVKGAVTLQDGFVLTVNATPADATIAVKDADSVAVTPITGTTNQFLLSGLGDSYTVTVSKTGYTAQTKTITNDKDQTITVTLVASGD